jgi:hypothetical protein
VLLAQTIIQIVNANDDPLDDPCRQILRVFIE